MRNVQLPVVVIATTFAFIASFAHATTPEPLELEYLLEMAPIGGDFQPVSDGCEPSFTTREAWSDMHSQVSSLIDNEEVIKISRWAQQEMQGYEFGAGDLPPLSFLGCAENLDVFETTLDVLPSHHPLVTRWLKAYLFMTLGEPRELRRVILTIRGELKE